MLEPQVLRSQEENARKQRRAALDVSSAAPLKREYRRTPLCFSSTNGGGDVTTPTISINEVDGSSVRVITRPADKVNGRIAVSPVLQPQSQTEGGLSDPMPSERQEAEDMVYGWALWT